MTESISISPVRLLFFLKRKEGMTQEQFSDYWCNTHAKVFLSLNIVKTNILRYEQEHTADKWISLSEEALGVNATDWDGVVAFDGESFEKIFEVFESEEYQRVAVPDEANFLDRAKCQMLPVITKFA